MSRTIVLPVLLLALASGVTAAQGWTRHAQAAAAPPQEAQATLPLPPIPPDPPPQPPSQDAMPPAPPAPPANLVPVATPVPVASPAPTPAPAMPPISNDPPPPPVLPPPLVVPARPPVTPPPPAISDDAPGQVTPMTGGIRVTFGTGRSDLNPAMAAAVRRMAQGSAGSFTVIALAAAEEDGSAARRLSLARGLAVRALLIEQGVPSARIYVKALGGNAAEIGAGPPDRVDIILAPAPAPSGKATP